jgi:apolipoprotein N-acyltransferase
MLTLPRVLAAVASGLALFVISPPIGQHWLHWFSFAPLFWALRDDDPRGNALLAWIAGYAGVSTLFFWLAESIVLFSNVPHFAALQIVHLFAFAFALPYALVFGAVHPLRRRIGAWWVLIVPALQVSVEFLGPALFPYYHGVSQYRTAWTFQIASVTGITGVSYLVFLTNCAVGEIIFRRREGGPFPIRPVAAAAAVFLANLGFGAWRSASVDAEVATWPTLRISQLQQDITMSERLQEGARTTLKRWLSLTSKLVGEDLDLVVWPEGATPYDPRGGRIGDLMGNVARNSRAPVIFGGGYREPTVDPVTGRKYSQHRNSIYQVDAQGALLGRYDKMVPMPFGEYIPFSDTFPFLKELIEGPGDFQPGEEPVRFKVGEFEVTTPICYEMILADFVEDNLADSDLMVNVTNDGWFGDTAAPHQHAMLSAIRAIELGMPVYRLAYTGVSMVVSPSGRITDETEPFTEVARVVEVPVGRISTIYRRTGPVLPWLCVFLALGGVLTASRRAPVTSSPTPS